MKIRATSVPYGKMKIMNMYNMYKSKCCVFFETVRGEMRARALDRAHTHKPAPSP